MLALVFASLLSVAQGRDVGYTQGDRGSEGLIAPGAFADTPPGSAHFAFDPPHAEVGEPVELVLIVPHASGERVAFDATAIEVDTSWVVLEQPTSSTTPDPYGQDRANTRVVWKLASFEVGDRESPAISITLAAKGQPPHSVTAATATLNVTGALGPNEDAPRPPKGFRSVAPEQDARAWLPWTIGGVAVLAVGGVALAIWLVKRSRAKPAPQPSRLELIEALAQRDVEQPVVVREVHYELARLLREVFDSRHGISRTALTDEEWLQAVAASFTPDHLRELADILRVSAEVKYGAAQPTQWAVRETIQRARKVAGTGTLQPSTESTPTQGAAA